MARSGAPERWLSVSEAGRALGLSRTSLLAAEEAGLLAPVRTPGGHRRYRPAELRRYLRAAGACPADATWSADPPPPDPGHGPDTQRIFALDLGTALRTAVRPVARALDAECAGVYLCDEGRPRFCAAFGVPRWLAERLACADVPTPIRQARDVRRPHPFEAAAAAFPEPRSTGQGIAVALRSGEQTVGVLFVVLAVETPPTPAELRTVEAFAELLALTIADRSRISALEDRLARVVAICST
jgi:hypothetical protein